MYMLYWWYWTFVAFIKEQINCFYANLVLQFLLTCTTHIFWKSWSEAKLPSQGSFIITYIINVHRDINHICSTLVKSILQMYIYFSWAFCCWDKNMPGNLGRYHDLMSSINSLWPSDAIGRHRIGSTLVQLMACCLTAPSHYLNQWWLIISKVQWHSSESNFTRDTPVINHLN